MSVNQVRIALEILQNRGVPVMEIVLRRSLLSLLNEERFTGWVWSLSYKLKVKQVNLTYFFSRGFEGGVPSFRDGAGGKVGV